ncbi:MAG: NADP-dependent oxidoreductase [Actinomycetota bacterium]|nr:NADP-dependent oxidoreductase [Actinomycetota bacterium]
MRAVVFEEYGDPQVLHVAEVPDTHAGPGQVRIAVKAASVNPVDWKFRAGYMAQMMPVEFPSVIGRDASGVVDEIGEGVTGVNIGDEVFGSAVGGSTAQFAVLVGWGKKPTAWSFAEAAGAGVASSTSVRCLDQLGVEVGKTILIEGAAGGVGSVAAQLAVGRGLKVIGTASEGNHEFLRSLGVIPTTYGEGLAARVAALAPEGVDYVIDTVGSGSIADLVTLVPDPNDVITVADPNPAAVGARRSSNEGDLFAAYAEVAALAEQGKAIIPIQATFGFHDAAKAHELSQTGHVRGKLVITP